MKFIHYVGGAFLHGRDVAAYGDAEAVTLRAETCGGKKIPGSREITMPRQEYEDLRDQWTQGGALRRGDARVSRAALEYMKGI